MLECRTHEFGAFTEMSQPRPRRVAEELHRHGKPYSAAISAPTLNVVNFVGRNPTGTAFSNVVLCCVVYIRVSASVSSDSVLTSPMD
jgi:hypothetical protein